MVSLTLGTFTLQMIITHGGIMPPTVFKAYKAQTRTPSMILPSWGENMAAMTTSGRATERTRATIVHTRVISGEALPVRGPTIAPAVAYKVTTNHKDHTDK